MPKGLRRYYGNGDLHFITFSCYRRLPLLGTVGARNIFVEELPQGTGGIRIFLVGYVVMPEHVHLLMSEPKKGTPSTVLQMLKQRVSRILRDQRCSVALSVPPSKTEGGAPASSACRKRVDELPQFWQPRFYDFNVYSHGKKNEKLEYMHANPVTRKLVNHPKDWPWSSFRFHATGEAGLVKIDAVNM